MSVSWVSCLSVVTNPLLCFSNGNNKHCTNGNDYPTNWNWLPLNRDCVLISQRVRLESYYPPKNRNGVFLLNDEGLESYTKVSNTSNLYLTRKFKEKDLDLPSNPFSLLCDILLVQFLKCGYKFKSKIHINYAC